MKNLKRIMYMSIIILIILITKVQAANKVIVLDPGHGGIDTGAINKSAGIYERDINLKIATYLKEYLNEYSGITVLMTHTGFQSGKMELLDRAMVGRNNNADMLISLHCNSSDTSTTVTGAEAFVTHNTSLPKYNEQCSKLANLMLNNLRKLGIINRGVKTKLSGSEDEVYSDGTRGDYYGIIRYSMKGVFEGPGVNIQEGNGMPVVLLEHCYIQNGDEKYINSDSAIRRLAKADCDAIVEFYGLHLKEKAVSAITLNTQNEILLVGDSINLQETIYPKTTEDKKVIWKTSDENIATVENGKVTAKKEGNVEITVTTNDGGYSDTCKFIIKNLEIQTNVKEIYCLKDEQIEFKVKTIPYLPEGASVVAKVEDENIANLDMQKQIITANNEGITNIIIQIKQGEEVLLEKKVATNVATLGEQENITIKNIKEQNGTLVKISAQTLLDEFVKNIEVSDNLEVEIQLPKEILKDEEKYIGTNTKVIIKRKENNEIIKTYYCKVYGDINEDGKITASDYGYIKNYIMKKGLIDIYAIDAADVSRDSKITTTDYGLIRNYIMKGTPLKVE